MQEGQITSVLKNQTKILRENTYNIYKLIAKAIQVYIPYQFSEISIISPLHARTVADARWYYLLHITCIYFQ